jgi:hypothetical protein
LRLHSQLTLKAIETLRFASGEPLLAEDGRQGYLQLIDATQWFKPLRRNLGKKNCELTPEDIDKPLGSNGRTRRRLRRL